MIFPADYFLDSNRPFFPAGLVSPQALENIWPIAKRLPPVSNIALECRLQAQTNDVDFIPQFIAKGGSGERLADPAGQPDHPIWQRIQAFCRQWRQPDSLLYDGVREIWLEFDVSGPAPESPLPSLFIGFHSNQQRVAHRHFTELTTRLLQPALLTPPLGDLLTLCFAGLPAGATLFSVGFMLARHYDKARICVGHLPKSEAIPYLRRVGWPGDLAAVGRLLADVLPLVDEFGLALDVGQEMAPRLGLECYLFQPNPKREGRWADLLAYLVAANQCSPEKQQALLAWPGYHFHGLTPEETNLIRQAAGDLPPRSHNIFSRKISHLKLVCDPAGWQESKAYLELNSAWMTIGR